MKKTLLAIAVGAMALASCSGNKAESATGTNEEANVTEQVQAGPTLTAEQKNAFIASGLVTEADFAKPLFVEF